MSTINKKSQLVGVRMPHGLKKAVSIMAESEHRSLSNMIVVTLADAVKKYAKAHPDLFEDHREILEQL